MPRARPPRTFDAGWARVRAELKRAADTATLTAERARDTAERARDEDRAAFLLDAADRLDELVALLDALPERVESPDLPIPSL